jgi:hypothetical protein
MGFNLAFKGLISIYNQHCAFGWCNKPSTLNTKVCRTDNVKIKYSSAFAPLWHQGSYHSAVVISVKYRQLASRWPRVANHWAPYCQLGGNALPSLQSQCHARWFPSIWTLKRSNCLATDDNMKHDFTSWLLTLDNDFFCTRTDALEHDVYHLLPMCHVCIEARIKFLAPECSLHYYRIFWNLIHTLLTVLEG